MGVRGIIHDAERTLAIYEIGEWAMAQALTMQAKWRLTSPQLSVHVNVSPHQFFDDLLPDHVCAAFGRSHGSGEILALEITETTMFKNVRDARRIILDLKNEWGVKFGLDDFGVGHSQLARLRDLPVDFIKIDRAFLPAGNADLKRQKIVEAMYTLARELQIDAIAEGIESASQWEWLRDRGLQLGQGFVISEPLPEDEVEHWLVQRPQVATHST